MINFEVDRSLLASLVPAGTELDEWDGRTLASLVGFNFTDTRLLGWAVPFHRDFEEINLRFYVRRKAEDEWRRGVVFIKEIVPRRAVTFVANTIYNERYVTYPTRAARRVDGQATTMSYEWMTGGRWHGISATSNEKPSPILDGSEQEFIAEHYWGYTRQRDGGTLEYRVEHPRWNVQRASDAKIDIDVAAVYGQEFVQALGATPTSAFIADGSEVSVYKGVRIPV